MSPWRKVWSCRSQATMSANGRRRAAAKISGAQNVTRGGGRGGGHGEGNRGNRGAVASCSPSGASLSPAPRCLADGGVGPTPGSWWYWWSRRRPIASASPRSRLSRSHVTRAFLNDSPGQAPPSTPSKNPLYPMVVDRGGGVTRATGSPAVSCRTGPPPRGWGGVRSDPRQAPPVSSHGRVGRRPSGRGLPPARSRSSCWYCRQGTCGGGEGFRGWGGAGCTSLTATPPSDASSSPPPLPNISPQYFHDIRHMFQYHAAPNSPP